MEMVNLKDYVVALESGSRPKGGAVSNGIPSLGGEHINEYGGFNLEEDKLKYVPEKYFNSMKKGIIREGDILIVKDGATTGKCAYVGKDFKLKKACVNEHIFVLRVNSKIDPKYLFYYLYSPIGQANILKDFRGATVGGISRNFIDMQIFLPSLQIQHKTVQVLDKAQALIDKRKEQIKLCDELIQSLFYDMFGDPGINSKGFKVAQISDLVDHNIKKVSKVYEEEDTIKYIDISSIDNETNKITNYSIYKVKDAPSRAQQCLCKGDIIISTVRPNLKNVAMVLSEDEDLVGSSGFCVLRSNKINNQYLFRYVLSEYFTKKLTSMTTGANYPAIKKNDVLEQTILLPPLELQNQFAEKVQKIEKQKQLLQQSLALLEDNFNSLMQKAFRGELFQ